GGDLNDLIGALLGGGAAPQGGTTSAPGGGATFYSPQDVQQKPPQESGAQLGQGTPGGSGKKDYGSIADAVDKMSGAVQKKPGKMGKAGKLGGPKPGKTSGKGKK
ncbi:MAG: hypothetical protein K8I30_23125, partial [Anaerolineae bacterium]|nr:hypothetical protein [Anaerolineae bacterium]